MDLSEENIMMGDFAATLAPIFADYKEYFRHFLKINSKEAGLIPFEIKKGQEYALDLMLKQFEETGRVRAVVVKARQIGVSTAIEGMFFKDTTTIPGLKTEIVSHEADSAENIFAMSETFLKELPDEITPSTLARQRGKKLLFDKEKGGGLGSSFIVKTADRIEGSRSMTLHRVHASEVAFWRDAKALMKGLTKSVPRYGSWIVMESTGNGPGGYFWKTFVDAIYGKNNWLAIFIPWYWEEGYQEPFHDEEERQEFLESLDEDPLYDGEKDLYENHQDCTLENLKWRRIAIVDECNGDLAEFHTEYPSTWREAFATTGRNVFDTEILDEMLINLQGVNGGELGRLEWVDPECTRVKFVPDLRGKWTIYSHPKPNGTYFSAWDSCLGIPTGDASAGGVINQNLDDMCVYHGHTEPTTFAHDIKKTAVYYNWHTVAPEINNHGHATVGELKQIYPNIYRRRTHQDHDQEKITMALGFETNRKTKPEIVSRTKHLISKQLVGIRDPEAISEFLTFVEKDNGKTEADDGCDDDRVDWRMIAYKVAKFEGKANMDNVYHNFSPEYINHEKDPISGEVVYRGWCFDLGGVSCLTAWNTVYGGIQIVNEFNEFTVNQVEAFLAHYRLTNDGYQGFRVLDISGFGKPLDKNGVEHVNMANMTIMELLEREHGVSFIRTVKDQKLKINKVEEFMSRSFQGRPGIMVHHKCRDLIEGFQGRYQYTTSGSGDIRDKLTKDKYASIHSALQNIVAHLQLSVQSAPGNIYNLRY